MPLKTYTTDHEGMTGEPSGTIASGVKSPDSDAELMIIEPIQQHPEISGMVRAKDPDTNWLGWVQYTPTPAVEPTPEPAPTPDPAPVLTAEEIQAAKDESDWHDAKDKYTQLYKDYVISGILTTEEFASNFPDTATYKQTVISGLSKYEGGL